MNNQTLILAFVLITLNVFSQSGNYNVYELDRVQVEEIFPCWYSFDIFKNQCSVDVEIVNQQTLAMDSLIVLIADSLYSYYTNNNIQDGSNKLDNMLKEWGNIRENLAFLFFQNFRVGTARGIEEATYRRDLTKQFIISLLPLINLIPE